MPLKNDDADVEKMMDDNFRREYGTAAFERVLARIQEISENVA